MRMPKELTREHVLQAIADLDAGVPHMFGQSRRYDLLYNGKRYAPKAVLGLAVRHSMGKADAYNAFSGGEATNGALRRLGFEIVPKDQPH